MEQVWYTINANIPAEGHYVIGDFNNACFSIIILEYQPVKWTD